MTRIQALLLLAFLPQCLVAQPAALEVSGVFGEGTPRYAANSDSLQLYKSPDLRSAQITIPYRQGWRIPVLKREGLTRILEVGALRVTNPDPDMYCSILPTSGPAELLTGEEVEYLYYVGEGFGEVRFRGGQCQSEVLPELRHFELIRLPDVQLWLKVFYADGSSPGWLLHDGTQTYAAGVQFQ